MIAQPFEAVRITDRVFWVGAIDFSLRDFHGYLTSRGTSYNAFLVLADQVTLIDTVKRPFFDEMMSRIASVIDPSRIRTVVSLHAEMDHSGALPLLLAAAKPARVLASKAGVAALAAHFDLDRPVEPVVSGAPIDLDGARFTFHDARMLHWPESMIGVLEGDDVVFSQDTFGMHLASHERFADQLPADVVRYETAKYFANVLMPFSPPMGKLLEKVGDTVSRAKVVATDHGPLWRRDLPALVQDYRTWCDRKPSSKVVIAYASMWQSTASMARAIAEGASEGGVQVKLMSLDTAHRSDVLTELLDAAALLVGSPNLNGQMFPTVADLLTYLKGMKPKNLIGAAFGSYGWNTAAVDQVHEALQELKVELVREPLAIKYVPRAADLVGCRQFGRELAGRIRARVPDAMAATE